MAKELVTALVMLILGIGHVVVASNSNEAMETVHLADDMTDDSVAVDTRSISGGAVQVQTSTVGRWGLPYPWWPDRFCSWDYSKSAVWQITFLGKSARCSDRTGMALAGLASRTVSSDRRIQRFFKGVMWKPLTAAPVLCAQTGSGQVTYTVRLQAPGPAVARLRTSGTQMMQSVFTATSVRSLKLAGKTALIVRCCRGSCSCLVGRMFQPAHIMLGLAETASQCCLCQEVRLSKSQFCVMMKLSLGLPLHALQLKD